MTEEHKCAQCGTIYPVWSDSIPIEQDDDSVMWVADPFASSLHDDYTGMWLCGRCYAYNAECI